MLYISYVVFAGETWASEISEVATFVIPKYLNKIKNKLKN